MRIVIITTVMLAFASAGARAEPSAEQLYEAGQKAFDSGDYATAVARWQSSYELSKLPLLLFNLGQAHRLAGDCERALSSYKRFVALDPTAEQRPLADDFVRELTAKCDGTKTTREKQPIERPLKHPRPDHPDRKLRDDGAPRPAGTKKIVGLTIVGAGAVSVAMGLYFGHRASSLGDEVTDACRTGCDWAVYGSKDAEGRSAETKQYVFAGIGVAAIIGGGVVYWLASREERAALIVIAPRRDGAAVTWSGSW